MYTEKNTNRNVSVFVPVSPQTESQQINLPVKICINSIEFIVACQAQGIPFNNSNKTDKIKSNNCHLKLVVKYFVL